MGRRRRRPAERIGLQASKARRHFSPPVVLRPKGYAPAKTIVHGLLVLMT